MAINTDTVPRGVNVNVAGGIRISAQGLVGDDVKCGSDLAGTFDMTGGCFYFCDGKYRQSLNVAFNEIIEESQECKFAERCEFDGIKLRP
jgi:hypothetical protein